MLIAPQLHGCENLIPYLISFIDIDDLMYRDVEFDHEWLLRLPCWSHALFVVGHEVLHKTVFMLPARCDSVRQHHQ